METGENPYWSEEVKTHYHTPPGTFTQNADEVVKILMKGAENDPTLALHRLLFYMNRAGDKLENAEQLNRAKIKLEEMIAARRN